MFAGILITLREGIEAFLVVGILLGILSKMHLHDKKKYIWWGSIAAVVFSIALAKVIKWFSFQFEGVNAILFEIVVASIALAILSYMVIWMNQQSKSLKKQLEKKIAAAAHSNHVWGLVLLAFITIIREGIETALFLSAVDNASAGSGLMTGAIVGLIIAAMITYLLIKATIRLDLRNFFLLTGSMVVVIAGGLLSHITMSIQELGWITVLKQIVWDMSGVIPDESLLGKLLHAFIGYMATPTVLQLITYVIYIAVMLHVLWKEPNLYSAKIKEQVV